MAPLRVLLVDGSPVFLDAAAFFLSRAPGIEIVGRCQSGREALEQVSRLLPDVVLMDLALPELNGWVAAGRLKALPDAPRVVIVTSDDELPYRELARTLKVDGFVGKSSFAQELLPLLRRLPTGAASHAEV